jgi:hypothetical protein
LLSRIRVGRLFSLNLLRGDRLQDANDVIKHRWDAAFFDRSGPTPWVVTADAVFFCEYRADAHLGDPLRNVYNLVFASVREVQEFRDKAEPLVNHVDWFWRLERPGLGPVDDPLNPRILQSP